MFSLELLQLVEILAKTLGLAERFHNISVIGRQVLIFLDSHCEVNIGWLEPLLARIKQDRRNVAIPIIDIINQDTMEYEASPLVRGGFNWGLFFRWDNIPESLLKTKDSFVQPIA